MTSISAQGLDHRQLNDHIRSCTGPVTIKGCLGQRYIASGMTGKDINITGIPGNALGAFLNGGRITVTENAQDAVGDTMNDGTIVVRGNTGDAAGYAMRGGRIYVGGDAGYRAGIHMKAYRGKVPLIVIGGKAGSFLGEYQAGGVIVVLGLNGDGGRCIGDFPCTGMHGGKVYIRSDCRGVIFPDQVSVSAASEEDKRELRDLLGEYMSIFGLPEEEVFSSPFTVVTPDSSNPYRQMYAADI